MFPESPCPHFERRINSSKFNESGFLDTVSFPISGMGVYKMGETAPDLPTVAAGMNSLMCDHAYFALSVRHDNYRNVIKWDVYEKVQIQI